MKPPRITEAYLLRTIALRGCATLNAFVRAFPHGATVSMRNLKYVRDNCPTLNAAILLDLTAIPDADYHHACGQYALKRDLKLDELRSWYRAELETAIKEVLRLHCPFPNGVIVNLDTLPPAVKQEHLQRLQAAIAPIEAQYTTLVQQATERCAVACDRVFYNMWKKYWKEK